MYFSKVYKRFKPICFSNILVIIKGRVVYLVKVAGLDKNLFSYFYNTKPQRIYIIYKYFIFFYTQGLTHFCFSK